MNEQLALQTVVIAAGVAALLIVCRYIKPLFEVAVSTVVIVLLLIAFALMLGIGVIGVVVVIIGYLLYIAYCKYRYKRLMEKRGRRQR